VRSHSTEQTRLETGTVLRQPRRQRSWRLRTHHKRLMPVATEPCGARAVRSHVRTYWRVGSTLGSEPRTRVRDPQLCPSSHVVDRRAISAWVRAASFELACPDPGRVRASASAIGCGSEFARQRGLCAVDQEAYPASWSIGASHRQVGPTHCCSSDRQRIDRNRLSTLTTSTTCTSHQLRRYAVN
jgi:hypothetical protein